MNKVNDKKVISKNIKGTRKKVSNKENIFKRFIDFIKKHKLISFSIVALIFVVISSIYLINYKSKYATVITINNIDYNKQDFYIYLFSAKNNYFGDKEFTENDLKVIYDEESKMTVGDYLKEVALSDIKTSSAIKMLGDKYNISLSDKDYKELEEEKEKFIKSMGGKKAFKKFLNKNSTSEESYDKMSEVDKLYKKITKNIFSEGKIKDLTQDEIEKANLNYVNTYFKIKQVILTIIDINTGKSLSSTAINQKETLANNIVAEAKNGVNFDDLIKKYSEDAIDKEPPYDLYYKSGELLTELENTVLELKPSEVSEVIKTDYAFHIIEKQELDDGKLNDYYDDLREEKCIDELKDNIDKLQIIYHDAYENIKIK